MAKKKAKKKARNPSVKAETNFGVGVGVGYRDGKLFGGPAVLTTTTGREGAPYNPNTGGATITLHGTDGGGVGVTVTSTDFNGRTGETTSKDGTFTFPPLGSTTPSATPPAPTGPDGETLTPPAPPSTNVDDIDKADFTLRGSTPQGRAAEEAARNEKGNNNGNDNGNPESPPPPSDAPTGGGGGEYRASDSPASTRGSRGPVVSVSPGSRPIDPRIRMDGPDSPPTPLPPMLGGVGVPRSPGDPAPPGDPVENRGPTRSRRP